MLKDENGLTQGEDHGLSPEDQYELWEWVRAAGVSCEELRQVLKRGATPAAS
jgi:hypothetical protein